MTSKKFNNKLLDETLNLLSCEKLAVHNNEYNEFHIYNYLDETQILLSYKGYELCIEHLFGISKDDAKKHKLNERKRILRLTIKRVDYFSDYKDDYEFFLFNENASKLKTYINKLDKCLRILDYVGNNIDTLEKFEKFKKEWM